MRHCRALVISVVLFGVFLAACGDPTHVPAAALSSVPAALPVAPAANRPAATAPLAGRSGNWRMPNLVGSNLQDAQNAIQRLTNNAIFFTTSHDATGAGRHQVLDRNWKVCSQNVPPGRMIQADTAIDFGAVKSEQRCP